MYQPKGAINIGCDPQNYPTAQYIETYAVPVLSSYLYISMASPSDRYKTVYTNPNTTTWKDASQPWPKNRLLNGGC